jgi:hypothetical protein
MSDTLGRVGPCRLTPKRATADIPLNEGCAARAKNPMGRFDLYGGHSVTAIVR